MKKSPKNWMFKFLIFLSIIVIAMMIGELFWIFDLKDRNKEQALEQQEQLSSVNQEVEYLNDLAKAYEWYIRGEYSKALDAFYQLTAREGHEEDSSLFARIQRIEGLLNTEDTSNADQEKIQAFQYSINQLEVKIDSVIREKDSLLENWQQKLAMNTNQIEQLEEELSRKQQSLQKEDHVKVISFTNSKGKVVHYLGEVDDQKANGGGVGIWNTGSIYRGDWKDNKRHGEGKFEWSDGHVYEGEYVDDKRNGQGTYSWPSGEKYVGEWSNDKRNGQGTLYDMDGNVQFEGKWLNDEIVK